MSDAQSAKEQVDERRAARLAAIGLPVATVLASTAVGVVLGVPMALLVLAAGTLLGTIALLWASLRVLSGDVALPPEIEALDLAAHGVDALAIRKKMLLRALKDLDNERALGKLETEDFEQLSSAYRGELKDVLRRIDATLEPFRGKAESLAREHLVASGAIQKGSRGKTKKKGERKGSAEAEVAGPERVACAKCEASNEPDAKFCKGCGAALSGKSAPSEAEAERVVEAADEA